MKKTIVFLVVIIFFIMLIIGCSEKKSRNISSSELQEEMLELVFQAKEGDKRALSELEKIAKAETNKSMIIKHRKAAFCWATRKNPDSIFVQILISAYKEESDYAVMRYILGSISQHYAFAPDAFLKLFEDELEDSEDSLEIDLISQRTVSRLLNADETGKLFPLLNRLTNDKAKKFLMRYLALKVGGSFYKKEISNYQVLRGTFPPCKLETISYLDPFIAELVVLKDSLDKEEREILIEKLYDKTGIYWTILGLLRENDEQLNNLLIEWIDNAPEDFGPYKILVSSRLKSMESSVELAGSLVWGNFQECKKCLFFVAKHIESEWEEKEAPEEIKEFARRIAKGAILGELSVRNFPGTRVLITGPGVLSKKRKDATYLFFPEITIEPLNISGREVIYVKDWNQYYGFREIQHPKGAVLIIKLKWYKDWIIVSLNETSIPPAGLGGGFQKLLFKKVNGEWRFAIRLESAIS